MRNMFADFFGKFQKPSERQSKGGDVVPSSREHHEISAPNKVAQVDQVLVRFDAPNSNTEIYVDSSVLDRNSHLDMKIPSEKLLQNGFRKEGIFYEKIMRADSMPYYREHYVDDKNILKSDPIVIQVHQSGTITLEHKKFGGIIGGDLTEPNGRHLFADAGLFFNEQHKLVGHDVKSWPSSETKRDGNKPVKEDPYLAGKNNMLAKGDDFSKGVSQRARLQDSLSAPVIDAPTKGRGMSR